MLRTAGDILLAVLADKKLIRCVTIVGLAASYKTDDAKLVRLTLDCIDETAEVVQSRSRESIPFCEALNIVLNAIHCNYIVPSISYRFAYTSIHKHHEALHIHMHTLCQASWFDYKVCGTLTT